MMGSRDPDKISGKLVCVIDDDSWVRGAISAILAAGGFAVIEASDGAEGIEAVVARAPSLVITDIVMPNREGIGVIREIKQRFPKLPILAISASGLSGRLNYLDHARKLGADGCLEKPFTPEELLRQVCSLMEGSSILEHASAQDA